MGYLDQRQTLDLVREFEFFLKKVKGQSISDLPKDIQYSIVQAIAFDLGLHTAQAEADTSNRHQPLLDVFRQTAPDVFEAIEAYPQLKESFYSGYHAL